MIKSWGDMTVDQTGEIIVDDELDILDDLDDIEFNLDEVENKIAPLALA